jgi:hypothetical protein
MAPVLSFDFGDGSNVTSTKGIGSGGKQNQQCDGDEQQVLCRASHVGEFWRMCEGEETKSSGCKMLTGPLVPSAVDVRRVLRHTTPG